MEWMKRVVVGASAAWIGFVILACSDSDTEVEGDLATSGRCPEGESCAPRGSGRRYFIAAKPVGAEAPVGELPPIATGAQSWVQFVEEASDDAWFGPEHLAVPGARIESEGDLRVIETPTIPGRATLIPSRPGTFAIRAVDERGNLHDRTRVRVVDAAEFVLRPRNFFVGPVGPATGWRVWPEATVILVAEARSATGELLVASTDGEDAERIVDAPTAGLLEAESTLGGLSSTAQLPIASRIDSIVGYAPLSCSRDQRDTFFCLYGVEDGSPVLGAPLMVEDVDEDGEPAAYELTSVDCVGRYPEPRTVTVSSGGSRWTQAIPAVGTSCIED